MLEEAGPRFLAPHFRAAGHEVEERLAAVGQVPEKAGGVAQGPPAGERGERPERGSPIEQEENEDDRGEGNDREDVAPEGQAQQEAGRHGDLSTGRLLRSDPTRGQHEGPGAEGEHLHVVPVVAEAVAGHEGRGKGRIEARREDDAARRARQEGQAAHRGHEERVEEDGHERERTRGVHERAENRGEVRLQAAAVRDVGNEHQVLRTPEDAQHDDAGERSIGGHGGRGALRDEGQAEENGHRRGQPEERAVVRTRLDEGRPARGKPAQEEERSQCREQQRGHDLEPSRAQGPSHVEPAPDEEQPEERGHVSPAAAPRTPCRGRSAAEGARPAAGAA